MDEASELPLRLKLESEDGLLWPEIADLRELLGRIGGEGDHFLVLERVPHVPRTFIQTYRFPDYFELEYRDGDQQFQARAGAPEPVLDTMLAWARAEPDWRSGHDWELAFQHQPADISTLDPTAVNQASAQIAELLTIGYEGFHDVARIVAEASEPDAPIGVEEAQALLEPSWRQRVAEQESWPEVTDVDRVEAALDLLADKGLTTRSHFACCLRCGVDEIREAAAPHERGYVFFHEQDAANAVAGTLFLASGAYSRDAAESTTIGHEVVAAMAEQGLRTSWDGSVAKRIAVVELDWKKRLE